MVDEDDCAPTQQDDSQNTQNPEGDANMGDVGEAAAGVAALKRNGFVFSLFLME